MNEVQEKQWALGLELTEDGIACNAGQKDGCKIGRVVEDKPMTITRATDADAATLANLAHQRGAAGMGEALRRALRRDLQPHRRADHGREIREVTNAVLGGLIAAASFCRRAVARIGTLMGYVAGWGFILCAAFITFDVIARRFFGFSSQATTELTGYALAFGISWALAHALTTRAHIRIDVLINHLPERLRYADASAQPRGARGVHGLHRQGRLRPGRRVDPVQRDRHQRAAHAAVDSAGPVGVRHRACFCC